MNVLFLIIYLICAVVAMVLQTHIIANKKNKVEQTKFDMFLSVLLAGLMSVFYVLVYYMVMIVEQKYKDDEKQHDF